MGPKHKPQGKAEGSWRVALVVLIVVVLGALVLIELFHVDLGNYIAYIAG